MHACVLNPIPICHRGQCCSGQGSVLVLEGGSVWWGQHLAIGWRVIYGQLPPCYHFIIIITPRNCKAQGWTFSFALVQASANLYISKCRQLFFPFLLLSLLLSVRRSLSSLLQSSLCSTSVGTRQIIPLFRSSEWCPLKGQSATESAEMSSHAQPLTSEHPLVAVAEARVHTLAASPSPAKLTPCWWLAPGLCHEVALR